MVLYSDMFFVVVTNHRLAGRNQAVYRHQAGGRFTEDGWRIGREWRVETSYMEVVHGNVQS